MNKKVNKKIYYLSTCSTCKKIMDELHINESAGFELQDIKTVKITVSQLDEMKNLSGNYESLFSRRAIKYKAMGLTDVNLSEKDYRKYILEEYTLLKRPVVIIGNKIFIGNDKKNIENLKVELW